MLRTNTEHRYFFTNWLSLTLRQCSDWVSLRLRLSLTVWLCLTLSDTVTNSVTVSVTADTWQSLQWHRLVSDSVTLSVSLWQCVSLRLCHCLWRVHESLRVRLSLTVTVGKDKPPQTIRKKPQTDTNHHKPPQITTRIWDTREMQTNHHKPVHNNFLYSCKRLFHFIVLDVLYLMKCPDTEAIFSVVCSHDILEQHIII